MIGASINRGMRFEILFTRITFRRAFYLASPSSLLAECLICYRHLLSIFVTRNSAFLDCPTLCCATFLCKPMRLQFRALTWLRQWCGSTYLQLMRLCLMIYEMHSGTVGKGSQSLGFRFRASGFAATAMGSGSKIPILNPT